ncbi:PAS domain-containing protein [Streptomyces sp. JJ36]|uniref:PAS domain-containing protein n=1 Tax=Streptomyces sp. JJ36 TaxID=2736645 RepID=UPI001F3A9D0D|nr:PAS domain-containing protein [Streptomyces sp. JJ36]MCF6522850.1 PAS domain-containing protein [Streptomyces sp. JJ36]
MSGLEDFGAELADFRRRVEELRAARALPEPERLPALDAALFELQHAVDVLWPRYEQLAAGRRGGTGEDGNELQLLRALFQRLPVAVALLDRDAVVRRLNVAATELFGLRLGYATGRSLTGSLAHEARAPFRSQVAAVARGEGARSMRVRLLRPPVPEDRTSGELRVTLSALRPPREPGTGALALFQRVTGSAAASAAEPEPTDPRPDLRGLTRHTVLLDLLDDLAAALLAAPAAHDVVAARAAGVLQERFADWVAVDLTGAGGKLRRAALLAPEGAERELMATQDPADCPVVVSTVRDGTHTLRSRPDDPEVLGHDETGAPLVVRAEVTSLLCVPLTAADPADAGEAEPPLGALTLLRTGGSRPFELAEAAVADRMARHLALALGRCG